MHQASGEPHSCAWTVFCVRWSSAARSSWRPSPGSSPTQPTVEVGSPYWSVRRASANRGWCGRQQRSPPVAAFSSCLAARFRLVLEDLHWADPETLAVVDYLADTLAAERVLCLATTRSAGPSHAAAVLDRLRSRRVGTVLPLAPLSDGDCADMVRACLSGAEEVDRAAPAFIAEHSDGLPFLIEELLAGLVTSGALTREDGRWRAEQAPTPSVPATFAASLGTRLRTLDHDARHVLAAAAVLGRRFDWDLLPGVAAVDGTTVVGSLRRAVDAQLVAVDAQLDAVDGQRFRRPGRAARRRSSARRRTPLPGGRAPRGRGGAGDRRSVVGVCTVELDLPGHDRAHRRIAGRAVDGAGEVEPFLGRPEFVVPAKRVAGSPAAIQPMGTMVPGTSRELTWRTELMRSSLPWPATAPGNSDAPVAAAPGSLSGPGWVCAASCRAGASRSLPHRRRSAGRPRGCWRRPARGRHRRPP